MVKSNTYFTALQFLEIGRYVHGVSDIESLANKLNTSEDIVKMCAEKSKLRQRIINGNDYQAEKALDDFANELASSNKTAKLCKKKF